MFSRRGDEQPKQQSMFGSMMTVKGGRKEGSFRFVFIGTRDRCVYLWDGILQPFFSSFLLLAVF
jgi:hypothetical protein